VERAPQSSILARNATRSPLGRISLAGLSRNGRGIPRRPMRVLGSWAVVYVLDGGGRYEDANGLRLILRAGDLLVVFPDLPHTYGPPGNARWTELYLVFDGDVFDLWRATGLLDPAQPVRHLEPIEHWAHRLESVLGAPHQQDAAPPLLEVCRLQMVLAEALAGGGGQRADEEAAWLARARALLEADLGQDLDIRALAADLGLSYDGFRKRFARLAGMPPARYRATRVIDRACELMQQGALTDRQIAEGLGFCDEFYFSRRFKQVTGRSPRQFRATLPRAR
jgi:AraC-like DNA-binding protein